MRAVIITGAAGGIGKALVRAFNADGYAVLAVDITAKPEDLPCAHYEQCDLARTVDDETYASATFANLRTALNGRALTGLINNAAVQILGPVAQLDRSAWRKTLDVNLLAPFLWSQAFLPELEAAGGSILNISSIHAKLTKPEFVAYATSKAALSGMTRAMAVELGARVSVNAIEPAAIETEMLKAGFVGHPEQYQRLLDFHPSGRIGSPSGLAALARTIISTRDLFQNGSCLTFDGGISAKLHDPS
jgi:NAD(P)-dependent dehydrogenase (short-subunit alcohol dehydrogenase family)